MPEEEWHHNNHYEESTIEAVGSAPIKEIPSSSLSSSGPVLYLSLRLQVKLDWFRVAEDNIDNKVQKDEECHEKHDVRPTLQGLSRIIEESTNQPAHEHRAEVADGIDHAIDESTEASFAELTHDCGEKEGIVGHVKEPVHRDNDYDPVMIQS